MTARRIAILGFAYDGEGFTGQDGAEVWAINNLPQWAERRGIRPARAYQLHPRDTLSAPEEAWVKRWQCPLYVGPGEIATYRDALDPRPYPGPAIHERLGLPYPWLLASSFSYAVAHACYEQINAPAVAMTLVLRGLAFTAGTPRERLVEYPALLGWLGLALGRGIGVEVAARSDLLHFPYAYGLEYWREAEWAESRVRRMAHAMVRYGLLGRGRESAEETEREPDTHEVHYHRCPTGCAPWSCTLPACADTRDKACPSCRVAAAGSA